MLPALLLPQLSHIAPRLAPVDLREGARLQEFGSNVDKRIERLVDGRLAGLVSDGSDSFGVELSREVNVDKVRFWFRCFDSGC